MLMKKERKESGKISKNRLNLSYGGIIIFYHSIWCYNQTENQLSMQKAIFFYNISKRFIAKRYRNYEKIYEPKIYFDSFFLFIKNCFKDFFFVYNQKCFLHFFFIFCEFNVILTSSFWA